MSRSAVSASGAPYVLELHDFEDPKFDDPRKPVFSVATPAGERLDMARLEQVPPEGDIDWLWPGMIPLRKVTLIEGPAGAGKSQLALDLAARVTRSAPWPDGQPTSLPTADVLVVCRKDQAAMASARFERAGGDRKKLFQFCEFQTFLPAATTREPRPIAFPYDFPALEHHVEMHESFGVIIIDSLADFCRTPRQVAETLVLLEDLASRANVALIVTLPANCRVDAQGRLRVASRWPTDRVRSAWCVLLDPGDPWRRLFVARRTNFCREPDGLAYRLCDRGVVWEAKSRISPVDPLGQLSASDLCLAELLAEGELPASTVFRLGGELGFSPKQLRAAGERLGVSSTRIGFSGKGHWSWSLPGTGPGAACLEAEHIQQAAENGHEKNGESMGMYGESMGNGALADVRRRVAEQSERMWVAGAGPKGSPGGDETCGALVRTEGLRKQDCSDAVAPVDREGTRAGASRWSSPGHPDEGPRRDDHVEQVSNLLVPPPASSASCTIQEEGEPRIGTNDGRGDQETIDDAERRDGRSHAKRGNEECMGTFGNLWANPGETAVAAVERPVGTSSEGNARERNRGESRRRRRKTRRNRKKEWKERLATGEGTALRQPGSALSTPS